MFLIQRSALPKSYTWKQVLVSRVSKASTMNVCSRGWRCSLPRIVRKFRRYNIKLNVGHFAHQFNKRIFCGPGGRMECCGKYENTLFAFNSPRVRSEKFANIFLKSMFRMPTERTYFCRVQAGRHAITRTFREHHHFPSKETGNFQYSKRFFVPETILIALSILSD